jgi:hypothetical protein
MVKSKYNEEIKDEFTYIYVKLGERDSFLIRPSHSLTWGDFPTKGKNQAAWYQSPDSELSIPVW